MSHYSIEDYNPQWVTTFQDIKEMLSGVFGTQALAIEHVGSTSIPGMKSKPIVDVLVVVKSIGTLDEEKEALAQRGYQVLVDYVVPNTLLFRKMDGRGKKLENIHVCESGAPMEKRFLVMRDYLRTFPDEARRYADFKETLYLKFPNDYESYRAAKDPFLQDLEQKAYDWKGNV